jgi:eukaryotic-like serine/threonine-protein kinase
VASRVKSLGLESIGVDAFDLERARATTEAGAADARVAESTPVDTAGAESTPVDTGTAESCLSPDEVLDFCAGAVGVVGSTRVQRHLDVCALCLDLVTGAINEWAPPEPTEWIEIGCNFRPGDRVAERYRIVRLLGRGGMGEVYEAIDLRNEHKVALKAVLAASSDNRHMLRSFRREAHLGRKIRHPNVCRVLAAPREPLAASPVPFFTMEFIDGQTLSERLMHGPLPAGEALVIAEQLLLGLNAIHDANVLHLDLKSSNVMLGDGERRAIILDFGLARRASRASRQQGVRPVTGSLAYMPPEQILGLPPSAQNDVFAFGVVLFQMLTARLPFPTAEPSMQSSLVRRLTAHAPNPSELVAGIPGWLDRVVSCCLDEHEHRYADADAVLRALRRGSG